MASWIFLKKWMRGGFLVIALTVISLIACLLLIEVVGRVSGLLKPPSRLSRFSVTKGYELDPAHKDINSHGLRDREYTLIKPPNTFRILAIGDSFTFGDGVTMEGTYVKQLEVMLNQKLDAHGIRYEVLNAGVPGYNTQQELVHFREIGRQVDPDMILLQFTLNDAELGHFGLKTAGNRGWLVRSKEWIKAHFALYGFIRLRFLRLIGRLNSARLGVREGDSTALPLKQAAAGKTNPGWERCRQSLAGFASTASALDIPILLVIYPLLQDLDETYPFEAVHALVAKTATAYGIDVVDLLPHFVGLESSTLWVSPKNSHPNAAAHAIAANGIYLSLLSHGFLPNSTSP